MRRRRRYRSSYDKQDFEFKEFISAAGQWLIAILVVVVLGYAIVRFGFQSVTMVGQSMSPALENHDVVFINKIMYAFQSPKRYDIIAFKKKDDEDGYFNIKRVVALPGETIRIEEGKIFINGEERVDVPFEDLIMTEGLAVDELTLGESEYFVIGDNCNNSEDSRFVNIGNVTESEISGKVFFRISPRTRIGFVE